MGKIRTRCQVCDGPVANGRCKLCGMPYKNDELLYHLNENRRDHYLHATPDVQERMRQAQIPLADRMQKKSTAAKSSTGTSRTTARSTAAGSSGGSASRTTTRSISGSSRSGSTSRTTIRSISGSSRSASASRTTTGSAARSTTTRSAGSGSMLGGARPQTSRNFQSGMDKSYRASQKTAPVQGKKKNRGAVFLVICVILCSLLPGILSSVKDKMTLIRLERAIESSGSASEQTIPSDFSGENEKKGVVAVPGDIFLLSKDMGRKQAGSFGWCPAGEYQAYVKSGNAILVVKYNGEEARFFLHEGFVQEELRLEEGAYVSLQNPDKDTRLIRLEYLGG